MCITIGVNDVTPDTDLDIKVYPTLFNQFVTIETTESTKRMNVFVTDLNGSIVFRKLIDGNEQLNLSNLAAGSYIIRIENADNTSAIHRKLIKVNSY